MNPFGFLFLIFIISFIGFLFGQIARFRGHSTLNEIDRHMPSEMSSSVKIVLVSIGGVVGFLIISILMESGPAAIIPLFSTALWLLTTVWVYLDAKARGGRAKAWAMLTFFTFVFGLCGYLITRPDKPRTCPRCAFRLREEFVVCPYCGPQAGLACPSCQSTLEPTWRYCPYCQTDINTGDTSLPGSGPFMPMSESPLSSSPVSSPTFPA